MVLNLVIVAGIFLVGVYTVFFGIQNLKEQNHLGFWAVTMLAVAVVVLPLYILFFKS